jgi:HD-GYP domain-containing protein (c-di-GMP phosphodiesterase class II)
MGRNDDEPGHENGSLLPINALSIALDERDTVTHDHCDRVSALAMDVGRSVGLTGHDLRCLRLASRLHDIGKIGIPDGILKKAGRLSDDEWVMMKTHSVRSERIVLASSLEDAQLIAKATRHHHERFDGRGYPDGLSGESIPVVSRIVAIVDTYDAMARLRLYGEPVSHRDIMTELARVAGTQHDRYLSDAFAKTIGASPFRAA